MNRRRFIALGAAFACCPSFAANRKFVFKIKTKVAVEQDKGRVRFVLKGREIVYDRSGFHIGGTASDEE